MRRILLLLLLLFTLPVAAQQNPLRIVASFSILADVVQNVAGETVEVTSLIPPGADPHAYTPTPRDIATLADADVVFINDVGFEATLVETIENAAPDVHPVVVSSCIRVLELGHQEEHETAEPEEKTQDADSVLAALCDQHDSELDTEHSEPSHERLYEIDCGHHEGSTDEHGECDPHVWTDPQNVIYWTLMIRDTLSQLDPANAESYAANAASYIGSVVSLDADFIKPAVATIPAENRILVTNHETMGYFASTYGFELVGTIIPGSSTSAEPSAAEIAALIDLVRDEGVPAIFAENTVNAQLAEQVAAEAGASFYTLYSDSLPEDGTYLDYMRYNVMTIVNALGGQS